MNSISVCMAVHNGSKYLKEQIDSILFQLQQDDEFVIFDDASTDGSADIIASYDDKRIKLSRLFKNKGVNSIFESAINYASNSIIVLADQDDVWPPDRIMVLLEVLAENDATCIVGNQLAIDSQGSSVQHNFCPTLIDGSRSSLIDLWKIFFGGSPYYGCCMAFDAKLKKIVLPFPFFIESHDLWIAICSALAGRNCSTQKIVTYRRIHGTNLSIIKRTFLKKLTSRFYFLHHCFVICGRKFKGVFKL